MTVAVRDQVVGNVVEVSVSGKLAKEDYEHFVPLMEEAIRQHGKVRLLVIMHDFHGWSAGALWQDIKFDVKHFNHIERLALVGESKWEHGMSVFCKPFTTATIRYFDQADVEAARDWIAST